MYIEEKQNDEIQEWYILHLFKNKRSNLSLRHGERA